MSIITKGVIPCGGLGTRFYPVSSVLPKEMLPLYNKPTLHYIVHDLVVNGIKDICFVISNCKQAIVEYFKPNYAMIKTLRMADRLEDAVELEYIYDNAKFSFVYQNEPIGSGDAVMKSKEWVRDDVFLLSWGDDIVIGNGTNQLIQAFDIYKSTIIGVKQIDTTDITKYGVVKISNSSSYFEHIKLCEQIIEKPSIECIPSKLASIGKYVVTDKIWNALELIKPSHNGEYLFTDALQLLCAKDRVYSCTLQGDRYDLGDSYSMLLAQIEIGLKSRYGNQLLDYFKAKIDS